MIRWQYEIGDISEMDGSFDSATAAHAKAVMAIDYWKREMKYTHKWDSGYDENKKALTAWQELQKKSAIIIASYQLKMF